jgi:hypothetical protein
MVEVIAILRAVSASIGLLKLAHHGIKEFQTYGQKLAKYILDIETVNQLLELWESEWEIGSSENGEEGIKYFGPEGWKLVRQQMALIADMSLDLVGLLAPPLPLGKQAVNSEESSLGSTTKKLQKRAGPPPEIERGREFLKSQPCQTLRALEEHKRYAEFLDNSPSFAKKIWEVLTSKNEDLSKRVSSLVEAYRQLENLSDHNFEARYRKLSATKPIQERQDAVQREYDSQYALTFRRNATSITYACSFPVGQPDAIALQLDCQKTSANFSITNPDVVNYTLITTPYRQEGSFELSVKAVGGNRPETPEPTTTFAHICDRNLGNHDQKGPVWLQVVAPTKSLYYSIQACPSKRGGQISRLADRLRSQYPEHRLGYRENLELAFRLGNSSFLLLNTSWMSGFSSENLLIRCGGENLPRYSLGFQEVDGDRCPLLKQLQNTEEPQAYSIGIMLIELALRKKVTGLQEQPLKIQLGLHKEFEALEDVIARTNLGRDFRTVVRHCFTQLKTPRDCYDQEQKEDLDIELLEEFHEMVLCP